MHTEVISEDLKSKKRTFEAYWECMVAGAAPGLQIRVSGRRTFRGVFDSHTFPPLFQGGRIVNTFDFIILAILAIGAIAGFQKGLITGISRFIGKLAAVAIAILFHDVFFNTADSIFGLKAKIVPAINGFITNIAHSGIEQSPYGNNEDLLESVLSDATFVLTEYFFKISSMIILFLLAGFIINLLISIIVKPLAQSLGVVNRGGGLIFGFLSALVGVCLVVGLATPFLTASAWGVSNLSHSITYPFVNQGYDLILGFVSSFAEGSIDNPLENFPFDWQIPI